MKMNIMKKTVTIALSLLMVLNLAACGNSATGTGQTSAGNQAEGSESTAAALESTDTPESQPESSEEQPEETGTSGSEENSVQSEESSAAEPEETEVSDQEEPAGQGGKVLVAYFSATNTTEGVAEHIAAGLNADIYEIVPEEPYTDADLNYNDNNSRSTLEMNDPAARPAISGSVEDMDQYSIVFVGYPIWWGDAPRIMSTFMESYDFSGKTIVPFCTSGGSGVGSSATNLEELTSGATWLPGTRLNGSDSQETVMEWVNGLGLNFEE